MHDLDPTIFQTNQEDIKKFKEREKANEDMRSLGLLSLFEYCCTWCNFKCCKDTQKRKIIFRNATHLCYYYLDITTFFKKMMEIDIIKYYLLDESERKLTSIIANPDLGNDYSEKVLNKLRDEYDYERFYKEEFMNNLKSILPKIVAVSRNNGNTKKTFKFASKWKS